MSNAPVIRIGGRIPTWSFPERLRKVRREIAQLKQEEFANLLGVKPSTYGAWETGRNTPDILSLSELIEEKTGVSKFWMRGDLDPVPGGPGTPIGSEGDLPFRSATLAQSAERFTRNEKSRVIPFAPARKRAA